MKEIDTREFISAMREITEEGREVSMIISGNSMAPFLVHHRDVICFKKPERELCRGDMVFYQRPTGQFVMHRIWKVKPEGYYITGDAQTEIEGPVKREQIFAVITKAKRKGKWIGPENFWWKFFERIWIRMVPVRPFVVRIVTLFRK